MNCIVLLLLLCCFGNSGNTWCGNGVEGNSDSCGCEDDNRDCGRDRDRDRSQDRDHDRDCGCDRDRDRDRDRDCDRDRDRDRDRCDRPGFMPPPWNDRGCNSRQESGRQDFSNYGRGETCGCETKE